MTEKKNKEVTVELASGERISVPRFEIVKLNDGREIRITKVSPFNKLLRHRFVQRGEYAKRYALEHNTLIPELPLEAHSTWSKNLWLLVEPCKKGIISCKVVCAYQDYPGEKQSYNVLGKESNLESRKRFAEVGLWHLFKSRIFISEDYGNALPVTTSYRKCAFCSKPDCIIQLGSGIPTFCDDKLLKYTKSFLIGYNVCEKYKRGFITVLQYKKILGREKIICPFCGSLSPVKINAYDSFDFVGTQRLQEEMFSKGKWWTEDTKRKDKELYDWLESLFNNPNLLDSVYECRQCFSKFDIKGVLLLRPYWSDI